MNHERGIKSFRVPFMALFFAALLMTGCGCPEAEQEIQKLRVEMDQVRSRVELWAQNTAKIGKALAARKKWIEKVDEHRKLVWQSIKKLSEESRDLRDVQLESLRDELQDLNRRYDEVFDELVRIRTNVDVLSAAFEEAEKKDAADAGRSGRTSALVPRANTVDPGTLEG
ncbi:MAG: hypothetical protein KTQ49_05250 [Candidatus Omnitrophica bacterium]|nr:hypothetical protein [Candidatus Omnitrophota bacterium]